MNDATTLSVFDRVAALAAEQHSADRASVTPETDLFDDLGADSLDRVELAMSIEEAFGIEVPDEMVETSRTVGEFARGVERCLRTRDQVR